MAGLPTSPFAPRSSPHRGDELKRKASSYHSNTKSDGSDDPDGRRKNRRVEIVLAK
jgi:flagellar motor protein MotB